MLNSLRMQETRIQFLTGAVNTGKTRFLEGLLPALDGSGLRTGGILAPGRYPVSGEKEYDLLLVPGRDKFALCTRILYPGWETIRDFRFNPQAIRAGLDHLLSLPLKGLHLIILDEVGPFELEGRVWAPAIPGLLKTGIPMIWTVRRNLIQPVRSQWGLGEPEILDLEQAKTHETMRHIKRWLGVT